jgi:hypothetical protein
MRLKYVGKWTCHPEQPNSRRRVMARDEPEPDHPKMRGCPILRALCEGWESRKAHPPFAFLSQPKHWGSGWHILRLLFLSQPINWVPHPSLFSSEGWDSTILGLHQPNLPCPSLPKITHRKRTIIT